MQIDCPARAEAERMARHVGGSFEATVREMLRCEGPRYPETWVVSPEEYEMMLRYEQRRLLQQEFGRPAASAEDLT